jgi:hypothetical protein
MRIRFTRAGYALAAGVAVTAMLGMSAAAANASTKPQVIKNATNACSIHCTDVNFQNPGHRYILGAHSGLEIQNNVVRLLQGSNGASKEDFRYTNTGTVFPLYCTATGLSNSYLFSNKQCQLLASAGLLLAKTFSLAFNPNNGGTKQLCVGGWNDQVANGWKLRLAPCGSAADTVLILTSKLPGGNTSTGDWLINGASNNFLNPLVATSSGFGPSQPTWSTVNFNGNKAVDTQEVHFHAGPF